MMPQHGDHRGIVGGELEPRQTHRQAELFAELGSKRAQPAVAGDAASDQKCARRAVDSGPSEILDQLPNLDGTEILELAAGIGRYTHHLAQIATHVTAVDFVEKFVDQNRITNARFDNISYRCSDVMNLDFEPGSFDHVFINWLFMYLDDRQTVLLRDRIERWLRPAGTVFLRESCFVGSSGLPTRKGNPARYRADSEYTRLFEDDFRLLHRGNVKVYEERFNNPHQYYWLFQRCA